MRHRKKLAALAILVPLLFAAVSGYWFWASRNVVAAVERWAEKRRGEGYEISFAAPESGGYPLAVSTSLGDPVIQRPDGWRWRGPPVTGRARLWSPNRIVVTASGHHRLSRAETGPSATFEGQADQALTALAFDGDGTLDAVLARITGLAVENPVGDRVAVATLSADYGPSDTGFHGDPEIPLKAQVTDIDLPAALAKPFGGRVSRAGLDGTLNRRAPFAWTPAVLEAWRKSGGKLDVERLHLIWGPIEFEAKGTVTLDRELRPLGAFEARVIGLRESLAVLSAAGIVPPDQGVALRLLLLALESEKDSRGRAVLKVPFSAQQGTLFLGPIPLLELGPVIAAADRRIGRSVGTGPAPIS